MFLPLFFALFNLRGVNSTVEEIQFFADGKIVGEHLGAGRNADPAFSRVFCSQLTYFVNDPLDVTVDMTPVMAEFCSANFPRTEINVPPTVVYDEIEQQSDSSNDTSLNDGFAFNKMSLAVRTKIKWLDALFYKGKYIGRLSYMTNETFWTELDLKNSSSFDRTNELHKMVHTPIGCDNQSVTARVCRETNPTSQYGELFRIKHVGGYLNGTVYWNHVVPRFLLIKGNNDTIMLDDCEEQDTEIYRCNHDNTSTSVEKFEAYPEDYHTLNRPISHKWTLNRFAFYVSFEYDNIVLDKLGNPVFKQYKRTGVFLQGFPKGNDSAALTDISLSPPHININLSLKVLQRKTYKDILVEKCNRWRLNFNNTANVELCVKRLPSRAFDLQA